ncbi:ELO family [Gigaspora rosea]|uniref:Elongation of fatty acids protein n=1 Tax=Gigaspora rosea TaxID=44941 RepID=A0A397V911_9GLOM|nr:ELO family [Gigaspora rosea]
MFDVSRNITISFDHSKWDYSQLTDPNGFQWKVGITPFSNIQIVIGSWITYFVVIIGLKIFMKERTPFTLRVIVAAHNLFLCILSAIMFGYSVIDLFKRWQERGIGECFCTSDESSLKGRLFYITYIYYLSKFIELIDTVILVLKKKEIIFLHWYHHSIVILMVWSWLQDANMYASMGMIANTFIHIFMYYYYFVAVLGRSVWFKKYVTTGQIIQFSISFILSVPYLYYHFTKECQYGFSAFLFSICCNGSFLVLFIRFYQKAYKKKGKKD